MARLQRAARRPLVTTVLIEDQVDAGRHARIEIARAEIPSHCLADAIKTSVREKRARCAIADDALLLLRFREENQDAVDLLRGERLFRGGGSCLTVQRRDADDDDFFTGLPVEIADRLIEARDGRRAQQLRVVLHERVASGCRCRERC